MKNLILVTTLLAAACGRPSASETKGEPILQSIPAYTLADIKWGKTQTVNFSHDALPVDGPRIDVTLTRKDGKYGAKLAKAIYDRINGDISSSEKDIGFALSCANNEAATAAKCEIDARPVDGSLVIIDIVTNERNLYDLTRTQKYWDRRNGEEVVKVETLVQDAELSLPVAEKL